jgi:hypothetical protein
MRTYRYDLGFAVDGVPIPDPTGFDGEIADLDSSAERDGTGLLHRNKVAQKTNVEMRYVNIDWEMCQKILQAFNHESVQFTYPDPNTGAPATIKAYAGNRKWPTVWMPAGAGSAGWYTNLTFSVIQY